MNIALRMQPDYGDFSYNIGMLYGIHVGHSFVNCLFYTAWLVFTFTNNILIINLFKFIKGMKSGLASLIAAVSSYQPIWFINLDQAAGIPVRFLAMACGEFSATSFWINGFISNYNSVYNTYSKLRKMSWFAYPTRNKNAIDSYKLWFLTRSTWPRTIFISNVSCSYQPAKESLSLAVPCLGIVDTNTYTHVVSIPIPGNDDSLDCLVFYNSFMSKFILLRKHYLIITWYLDTRNIKRIFSFKEWVKKKNFNNSAVLLKKKKNLLLSNIKFRFSLLKNIQLGMNILFKQNSKYSQKNFEYLDIFKYGKRKNNKSIEKLLIIKKKWLRTLDYSSKYYTDLKRIYFNKKLWNIHYMVRSRFFQDKYFKTTLYTQNYFLTNIKIERFYKTHLRWNSIDNTIAPKIFKFFLFYNFLKFKKLSTKIYNSNILNSVYFKLILNQLWSKIKKLDNNPKISYKKELNFFSFQNLYKFYNKRYKNMLIGKFFIVLNKKNWLYLSKFNRNLFFSKIKFLYEFKMFRKFYKIKNLIKKNKLYTLNKIDKKIINLKKIFIKYYKFGLRKLISILTYKKVFLKYKKLKQVSNRAKTKSKYFFNKQKRFNYLRSIGVIKYTLEKKFKYLDRKVGKKRKVNKYLTFLSYNKYIQCFLYFMKSVLSEEIWEKYKQILFIFVKLYTHNHFYHYEFKYLYFRKLIIATVLYKIYPIIKLESNKSWDIKKIFMYYLKKINEKKSVYKFLSMFKYKAKLRKVGKKFLYNKNSYNKNKYFLYSSKGYLQSFYNIIKYEYKLYLKKNPYKINSSNYRNYINYVTFIKWKRNKIINNINWKIFIKYFSYNKKDFYKDLFVRYKNLCTKIFVYKKNKVNSLFTLLDTKNKFLNNFKYSLGWFVFKMPVKVKDWFYQKDFFCFPNWFYNYKKISHKIYPKIIERKSVRLKRELLQKKLKKEKKEWRSWRWLIMGNKKIKEKKRKKLIVLNYILTNYVYFELKSKKKNLYLSLKHKKLLPLNYEIRKSIKKTLLNYAYVLWSKKYKFEFKKEFLTEVVVFLFKHYSVKYKKRLLDKIRFNRKIRNWQIKLGYLNKIEDLFYKSLNYSRYKRSLRAILDTKWYDEKLKKKNLENLIDIWEKNKIINKKRLVNVNLWVNNLFNEQVLLNIEKKEKYNKYKEKLKKEKEIRKQSLITYNFYALFQKKYNQKLLNKYSIGSSINNLFSKFYNIPKLNNYKEYYSYLKHFKLIITDKLDKKRVKSKKRKYRNFRESKFLVHKHFLYNNNNINLYKFYKMYGFKWSN